MYKSFGKKLENESQKIKNYEKKEIPHLCGLWRSTIA